MECGSGVGPVGPRRDAPPHRVTLRPLFPRAETPFSPDMETGGIIGD